MEMELATQVQTPDEAVYNSFCTNALEKGINPSFLSTANYRKIVREIGFFSLV